MPAESTTPAADTPGTGSFPPGLHVFRAECTLDGAPLHPLSRLRLGVDEDWPSLLSSVHAELLRLAEDPDERVSAGPPLEALSAMSAALGQPEDSSSLLGKASAHHAAAEQALRAAHATRGKTRDQALRRLELLEELDRLRARQSQLRAELERGTLAARARKLADARALRDQLDDTTQRCFALSSLREFPLDQEAAVQRADRRATEAHDAHEAVCALLDDVVEKLEAEQARFEESGGEWLQAVTEDWEARLAESDAKVAEKQSIMDAAVTARDEVAQRLEDAERALRHLPDFGQFAGDPMEWVNQMTTTFQTHARMRNGERALRDELRAAYAEREEAIAAPRRLFVDGEAGIVTRARSLEKAAADAEAHARGLAEEEQFLQLDYREVESSIPGFRGMAALMAAATAGFSFLIFVTRNPGLIYALGGVALALLFFSFSFMRDRRRLTRIRLRLNQLGPEAGQSRATAAGHQAELEQLLENAGVATVRELDAAYERYREGKAAAEAVAADLAAQEEKAAESEQHTAALFQNLRETFERIGEDIVEEGDVPEAAARALSTYQQYRDAKRRRAESRDLLQRREREAEEAEASLNIATQEDVKLSLQARDQLRRAGFADERKHAGALQAFRAYRLRHAQQRTRHGRMELMEERRRVLEARAEATGRARDEAAQTLERLLEKAGVQSVHEWFTKAEDARVYRESWAARTRLQEELDALLAGESLEELAAEIDAAGDPAAFDRSPETIQSELESVSGQIDEALEEAETLGQRMDRGKSLASLNELEEAEAVARESLTALTAERRATGQAAAALQDAVRTRRASLAARLAPAATGWLQRLTGRTDASIAVPPDLAIRAEGATPPTGVVALAIRLSLLEVLMPGDAAIPLLIEGQLPLADGSARATVLEALAEAARQRPVLWCAGPPDWIDAARELDIAVREPTPAAGD